MSPDKWGSPYLGPGEATDGTVSLDGKARWLQSIELALSHRVTVPSYGIQRKITFTGSSILCARRLRHPFQRQPCRISSRFDFAEVTMT